MLSAAFLAVLLGGAILALPYLIYTARSRRPRLVLGAGLLVAALLYVAFALLAGEGRALLIEAGGVLLFALPVALGLRWSPYWLALGWLGHVAWDVGLHPVETSAYSPWWYPVLCVGFDLVVAGFAVAIAGEGARSDEADEA